MINHGTRSNSCIFNGIVEGVGSDESILCELLQPDDIDGSGAGVSQIYGIPLKIIMMSFVKECQKKKNSIVPVVFLLLTLGMSCHEVALG